MTTRLALPIAALLAIAACSEEPDTTGTAPAQPTSSAPAPIDDELVRANNRAVALMGRFDYDGAREAFAELHEANPGNHEITVNLAVATLNRQRDGDEAAALALLDGVLAQDPEHLRARYCAGLLSLNNGKATQALEHFKRVADTKPDDAFAQYYTGLCLSQTGIADMALERYERALELDPYLRSAYYGIFQVLQRAGERELATEKLEIFQKLADNPRAQLAEFKYTRMGALGMAMTFDNPNAEPVAEADPFRAFGEPVELVPGARWLSLVTNASTYKLSAADVDDDGDIDVLIENQGVWGDDAGLFSGTGSHALLINDGGTFSPTSATFAPKPVIAKTLWGDLDNDGDTDAYFCLRGPNVLMLNEGDGSWRDATEELGVSGGNANTLSGTLVDADHDGDLDIFLANAESPNALLNNNRDGSFTDIAPDRGITGTSDALPRGAVFADLDNDRDLDFIVLNSQGEHEVYENMLLWEYRPMDGFDAFKRTPLAAVSIADTDIDGIPELFTVNGETMSHWFPQEGEWTAVHNRPVDGSRSVIPIDADNDGAPELLHFGGGHATLAQLHPGDDTWSYEGDLWSVTPVVLDPSMGVELIALRNGVPVRFPGGEGRQRSIALNLSGAESAADSMRTNFSAIGTTVRARVGSRWSSATSLPNSTSIVGQSLAPLAIGIGPAERVDSIEILWPDGVYQTELGLEAGKLHDVPETQRQLSSCPVLFAWDGERHRFVSDILGTGGIGFALAPGVYAESDPTERFLFPEGSVAPRDGAIELKIGEPMEEVAYIDRLKMFAYDLPPGWSMTLDERMHTGGPFVPTGEAIFYRRTSEVARATNDRDEEITESIATRDNAAAPLPPLDRRFIGRTSSEHVITLEFDEPIDSASPVLVMDAWVEYPYSQVMFAAWQAGAEYQPMTLEALDPASGEWVVLNERFGYPAGMPRQASAPIRDLPAGARSIRIRTTLEVYFDRIFVAHSELCGDARVTELPLLDATLAAPGFPRRINHPQRRPDYDERVYDPLWDARHPEGRYTSLGPCEALLTNHDGAMSIFGPGEEITARFAQIDRAPAQGWTRRFVLDAVGWCKDMDLYTKDAGTVTPLPSTSTDNFSRDLHNQLNIRWTNGR